MYQIIGDINMTINKMRLSFSNVLFRMIILSVMIWILVLGQCMTVFATTQNQEKENDKVIRVAYVLWENFQEGAEGEPKYGYGYEYLKKISYYTGWKYEYVYGSFAELLEKLAKGEIDLMANISYTEERAKLINFSNEAQGDEYFYVYGYNGQTKIDGSDPSTFNGKKVGVNAGSYQLELFKKWCEENHVTCEIIEYTDFNKRKADLESGILDATVATDAFLSLNWVPLIQIGKEPYYFGVAKERNDVLVELNDAMRSIKTANPFFNDELRTKYFNSDSSVMRMLTEEEKEWLEQSPKIQVGYLNDYIPYSVTDQETGKMEGMVQDLLDNIKKEYGMDYSTKEFSSYPEMLEALQNKEVDAIFPVYGDTGAAELQNLMVTDPVTTTTLTMFYSEGELEEVDKIAIDRTDPFQEQYVLLHYPEAEQIKYDSFQECLEVVIDKEVDCAVRETSKIDKISMSAQAKKLQRSTLREFVNVSFATREGDIQLLAVLNKGIGITDESLINNSLVSHSQMASPFTFIEFLREYVVQVLCLVILVFGVIIGILIVYYRSVTKSRERISKANRAAEQARYESEHDSLTGLLNRKAFQDIKKQLRESSQPFAFLLIDGDKFKGVNDSYGHEIGDRVLQKIASQMEEQFRSEDYLIRLGGDEFVAIIMDITYSENAVIKEKIDKINIALQQPMDDLPKLSISVGIAFAKSGYEDELFQKADEALYQTKAKGGCGYTIYGQGE